VARSVIWSLVAFLVPLTIVAARAAGVPADRWFLTLFETEETGHQTLRCCAGRCPT
jgi:hypothetical protein